LPLSAIGFENLHLPAAENVLLVLGYICLMFGSWESVDGFVEIFVGSFWSVNISNKSSLQTAPLGIYY